MSKRIKVSGNIKGQLVIPGLEGILSSVDMADSRQKSRKLLVDESWGVSTKS
jgi:hypothetical protein